jgi:single-stranded-DNA-specific exonuclease
VALGLSRIVDSPRPGLRRLCEATGTAAADPEHVIRRLVPRLNASGRLGEATAVWRLLLREPGVVLEECLDACEAAHTRTKELQRRIIAEAESQVSRVNFKDELVMVVGRQGWHRGLMGPLASQLAQRYGRPAIALAFDRHEGTGSGRSIPVFNLFQALQGCQDLLVRFGGHAQACGLTLAAKDLERFRQLVNEQARKLMGREGLVPTRLVDLELPLAEVAPDWVAETARFAPFGQGNPRPVVALRRVRITMRSPRVAELSDGTTSVAARGRIPAAPSGIWDVLVIPAMAAGGMALTVRDVRLARSETMPSAGATEPSPRGRTSDTSYTPALA